MAAEKAANLMNEAMANEIAQINQIDNWTTENLEDDSYCFALAYQEDYQQYFNKEFMENAFYIVGKYEDILYCNFRKYLNLQVSIQIDEAGGKVEKWKTYNEKVTKGYLCDELGNYVKGWGCKENEERRERNFFRCS